MTTSTDTARLEDILGVKLSLEDTDDDPFTKLTRLILSATSDQSQYTLSQIADILTNLPNEIVEKQLDPLSTLSYLLPSSSSGSVALLELMMEKCSPKEVIVAAEENLERIYRMVSQDEYDEDDDEENDNEKEEKPLPVSAQIPRLVRLFSVTSKIPFRRNSRKSPSGTIKSFIPDLQSVIQSTAENFSKETGRETLLASAVLVEKLFDWIEEWARVKRQEPPSTDGKKVVDACKAILLPFLISTVDSLVHCIQAGSAKRAFNVSFPRIARDVLDPDWEKGASVADAAISAYARVGGFSNSPSTKTSFVLLVHSLLLSASPSSNLLSKVNLGRDSDLSTHIPVIVASIQTNSLLDESLAALLLYFSPSFPSVSFHPSRAEILTPFLTLLPPLASFHPDPFIRHCTFRVLGLLLDASPEVLRMQILKDLVSDKTEGNEKMRIAAVGLVKDAVLKALSQTEDSSASTDAGSMLASPRFLQTFAPILFVADPPNLFDNLNLANEDKKSNKQVMKKLSEEKVELELSRLAECLSLYYVLLKRDERNRTGIRDTDNQTNVERTLLRPMRKVLPILIAFLEQASGESAEEIRAGPSIGSSHVQTDSHTILMPLIALKVGLERIDEYNDP